MTYVDYCSQAATLLTVELLKAGLIHSDQIGQTRRAIVIALEQAVRPCCNPPETVHNADNV